MAFLFYVTVARCVRAMSHGVLDLKMLLLGLHEVHVTFSSIYVVLIPLFVLPSIIPVYSPYRSFALACTVVEPPLVTPQMGPRTYSSGFVSVGVGAGSAKIKAT